MDEERILLNEIYQLNKCYLYWMEQILDITKTKIRLPELEKNITNYRYEDQINLLTFIMKITVIKQKLRSIYNKFNFFNHKDIYDDDIIATQYSLPKNENEN